MKLKAAALTALLSVLSAVPSGSRCQAQVYYSPVFNMPLQPAPSPRDGGYSVVAPNGSVCSPSYYVMPPFTPITGFNGAFVGQTIFAKMYEEAVSGELDKGHQHGQHGGGHHGGSQAAPPSNPGSGGGMPPPKQIGVGGYTMDYSDPDTFKNFDATAPMVNGYVPFGSMNPRPPQTYGNGPMPMPRYANYPYYQAPPPPPPAHDGYGFRPYWNLSQAPQQGPYQSGYYGRPQYSQAGYCPGYGGGYWQNPIVQVQGQAPQSYGPIPMPYSTTPYPQGQPTGPGFANPYAGAPCPPYGQAAPYYPLQASPSLPNMSMPYYPTPNYSMPPTCFPTLPNPSYEPPCAPDCEPRYFQNSMVRSPRDFFMWGDVQADKAAAARKPLTVP